jgi:diketogulonate reductase-like aldo/keto reductase
MYGNEHEVGQAIKSFLSANPSVSREEIWYTTKLASNGTYDQARKSIKRSLEACGLDRIDLFLLHSPYGGKKARLDSWRAVEDAIDEGEVGTGGVSNFGVKHVCIGPSHRRPDANAFILA